MKVWLYFKEKLQDFVISKEELHKGSYLNPYSNIDLTPVEYFEINKDVALKFIDYMKEVKVQNEQKLTNKVVQEYYNEFAKIDKFYKK